MLTPKAPLWAKQRACEATADFGSRGSQKQIILPVDKPASDKPIYTPESPVMTHFTRMVVVDYDYWVE